MDEKFELTVMSGITPDQAFCIDTVSRHFGVKFQRTSDGSWRPGDQLSPSSLARAMDQMRSSPGRELYLHCPQYSELDVPLNGLVACLVGHCRRGPDWGGSLCLAAWMFEAVSEWGRTPEFAVECYSRSISSNAEPATAHEKMAAIADVLRKLRKVADVLEVCRDVSVKRQQQEAGRVRCNRSTGI